MWKIFIIIFGVLFGIFMPKSIYENYTDTTREDSTYEEDSYVNSEDSTYEEYPYVNSEDGSYEDYPYPYPDPEYAAGRGNLKTYNNMIRQKQTGKIMGIPARSWRLRTRTGH